MRKDIAIDVKNINVKFMDQNIKNSPNNIEEQLLQEIDEEEEEKANNINLIRLRQSKQVRDIRCAICFDKIVTS